MPQSQSRLLVHFVWTTHRRMSWLTPQIAPAVYRYIEAVVREQGCEVLAIGGMPDHLHLFVCLSTNISASLLMRHVKGSSSRLINRDLSPDAFFKWQDGYGAYSVSASHRTRVIAYIQSQEQHHREGSLWQVEPTDTATDGSQEQAPA